MSHNTADCKRYSKDGSLKKGFKKPEGQGNQSFVTIMKEVAEVKKMLKDKKRTVDDNDSD